MTSRVVRHREGGERDRDRVGARNWERERQGGELGEGR
jgi:hypothetical protein